MTYMEADRWDLLKARLNVPLSTDLGLYLRDAEGNIKEEYHAILREFGISHADIPRLITGVDEPEAVDPYLHLSIKKSTLLWSVTILTTALIITGFIIVIIRHYAPLVTP